MANEHTAMFILILANVWRGVPMLITMFLAGLQEFLMICMKQDRSMVQMDGISLVRSHCRF